MVPNFHNLEDFVDRLAAAAALHSRPIAFLVGSPLTAPSSPGAAGVPMTDGVVSLVRESLGESDTIAAFDDQIAAAHGRRYQAAFQFLIGRRGQDAANRVIKQAVMKAYIGSPLKSDADLLSPTDCEQMVLASSQWDLPSAVRKFGNLLSSTPKHFGRIVLTTNFDPLIEVSLAEAQMQSFRTVLHLDGNLSQTQSQGVHIVHLHGYWSGYDTLHTPQQLTQPRPQLKSSLTRLVDSCTLVVLGYGGWDDVLTRALIDALADANGNPEVLWGFHQSDQEEIVRSNGRVLELLEPGLSRGRAVLYAGVEIANALQRVTERIQRTNAVPTCTVPTVAEQRTKSHAVLSSDSVPGSDAWVGRAVELELFRTSRQPVIFVTGLGGQGKSLLAAEYVRSLSLT